MGCINQILSWVPHWLSYVVPALSNLVLVILGILLSFPNLAEKIEMTRKYRILVTVICVLFGVTGFFAEINQLYANEKTNEEILGNQTGGKSFAYATFYGISDDKAYLLFHQKGEYPLHNATAFLIDLDKYNVWATIHAPLKAGDVFPGQRVYSLGEIPVSGDEQAGELDLDPSGHENLLVNYSGLNGYWAEYINMRRMNGKWLQAKRVIWIDRKPQGNGTIATSTQVFEDADADYPHKDGKIDWNY